MPGARCRDLRGENNPPLQAWRNDPHHCQQGESAHTQKARREYETTSTEILSTSLEKSSYRKLKKFPRSQHKTPGCILVHPSPRRPAYNQVPEHRGLF